MEFFFHKQYRTFTSKRLPTSNSCCFKVNEAKELEARQICALLVTSELFENIQHL